MNIPVDASQALGSMYRESFTLNWSLGVAVPLKAGVRVYFPLSKRPGALFTQLRVWSSKQVDLDPAPFTLQRLASVTVTLVDANGSTFVDNAPITRFVDAGRQSDNTPLRPLIFAPRALDTRSSYVMWNDNANTPSPSGIVLGLFYQTP